MYVIVSYIFTFKERLFGSPFISLMQNALSQLYENN